MLHQTAALHQTDEARHEHGGKIAHGSKSIFESDSAPALFRFDISFLFFVVISVGDRLSVIVMSGRRSLCITFDEPLPPLFPVLQVSPWSLAKG